MAHIKFDIHVDTAFGPRIREMANSFLGALEAVAAESTTDTIITSQITD